MVGELHIVTVATESKYYFPYLVKSCRKNGKELEILGMGEKWEGFNWKFKKMIEYLTKLPPHDIVCFIDGYDVLCTRNLNELKTAFIEMKKKHNCKIIAGNDKVQSYIVQFFQYFFFGKCKNESLNSGTYIGYATDLLEIVTKIYELNPKNEADDQVLMTKYCVANPDDICIDVDSELFLTICDSCNELDNHVQINTQTQTQTLMYNNRQPFFIHANGFGFLDNIITKLGYEYNDNIKDKLRNDLFQSKIMLYVNMVFNENMYLFLLLFFLISIVFIFMYRPNSMHKYLKYFYRGFSRRQS
jgi:hypothetical protein